MNCTTQAPKRRTYAFTRHTRSPISMFEALYHRQLRAGLLCQYNKMPCLPDKHTWLLRTHVWSTSPAQTGHPFPMIFAGMTEKAKSGALRSGIHAQKRKRLDFLSLIPARGFFARDVRPFGFLRVLCTGVSVREAFPSSSSGDATIPAGHKFLLYWFRELRNNVHTVIMCVSLLDKFLFANRIS